jgi:hypothetical protein
MEFTAFGFDVYTPEIDDKGIDFIVRVSGNLYYDVQVKSLRKFSYFFFLKKDIELRNNFLIAFTYLPEKHPAELFVIPSTVWLNPIPPFVDHNYDTPSLKSPPEYGFTFSKKYLPILDQYRPEHIFSTL